MYPSKPNFLLAVRCLTVHRTRASSLPCTYIITKPCFVLHLVQDLHMIKRERCFDGLRMPDFEPFLKPYSIMVPVGKTYNLILEKKI